MAVVARVTMLCFAMLITPAIGAHAVVARPDGYSPSYPACGQASSTL
jgi:hypothetical protein